MEISLGTVNPEEYIREHARYLDAEVVSRYNQYWLNLPPEIGEGIYKGIAFNDGFNLFQYKMIHHTDMEIFFEQRDEPRNILIFNLKEKAELKINGDQEKVMLDKYQNFVISIPEGTPYSLKFSKNRPYFLNILDISGLQINFDKKNIHAWEKIMNRLFQNFDSSKLYIHKGNYNLASLELFEHIENFKKNDMLEYLFLDAKAHEILVRQLSLYESEIMDPEAGIVGSAEDAEIIASATRIIKNRLGEIKTVTDLARSCATNNNKLQEGFRRYLGQTVNRYLISARMERGRDLLIETNYTISEIVDRIGLRSKSYFSKMFREKYGFSPSEFRRRLKRNSEVLPGTDGHLTKH
ncbi:AraC family transcriptional regulator [Gramella sp. GC03-9]|uniref:AraC family transcriptional regulator n=1 Tax=Christiangramia oceanisediminis TaxID=2920386 RepID=A0A9X2KY78_9FLAO|nr:AraC family transcriptional regulator [Gramella oceanisediminis]MCP9200479.1 AraC family transcriptional regulator [Gramella oceanisediminis]